VKDFSPRAGLTYAVDESRKTVARASFSRYAGQLETGTVGVTNPSTTDRLRDLPLVDLNNDHFAQANEVQLNNFITAAGGFNPASPTRSSRRTCSIRTWPRRGPTASSPASSVK